MKVVLDTNIFISAFLYYGGNCWELLRKAKFGRIQLFISAEIIDEFIKVVSRPKFGFNQDEINKMRAIILDLSWLVAPTKKINVIKTDKEDNKFLECALAAGADYIVSGDKHLLELKEYKHIKIVKPKKMLEILKGYRIAR